jgi:tRNA 2-thiouridine synthesizing protein A
VRWLVRTAVEPRPDGAVVIDDLAPTELVALIAAAPVAVWSEPADTLDLTGEVCPYTFVRTKLRLEEMKAGAHLRVLVDHEPATRNVPRSAREWGQDVLGVAPIAAGRWEIWIRRKEP